MQAAYIDLQEQEDGITRPVGYWSSSNNDAQRAYVTRYCEYYVLVGTVLLLQTYSVETRFTIRTNHDFFKWIPKLSMSAPLV